MSSTLKTWLLILALPVILVGGGVYLARTMKGDEGNKIPARSKGAIKDNPKIIDGMAFHRDDQGNCISIEVLEEIPVKTKYGILFEQVAEEMPFDESHRHASLVLSEIFSRWGDTGCAWPPKDPGSFMIIESDEEGGDKYTWPEFVEQARFALKINHEAKAQAEAKAK